MLGLYVERYGDGVHGSLDPKREKTSIVCISPEGIHYPPIETTGKELDILDGFLNLPDQSFSFC